MKIIIPMAGEGKRFQDAGYTEHKAILPMVYRKTGESCPMVVCSVKDLPGIAERGSNIAFIMRDFHKRMGIDQIIRRWYADASFFSVKELTRGQACTCLLAESFIGKEDELLIAACDNGIEYRTGDFERAKQEADLLVFTFKGAPQTSDNPDAFGWIKVNEANGVSITGVSVKRHISENPEKDQAIVGTFWFRKGRIFLEAADKMIREDDYVNNEFYVDQAIKHALELGYKAKIFEVSRFLNYGSPEDYENYGKNLEHFARFIRSECYWRA